MDMQISRSWLLILILFTFMGCFQNNKNRLDISTIRENADKLSQKQAVLRKDLVSNINYALNIDLIKSTDAYFGTVEISFDLKSNDHNLTIDFTGGEVESIYSNSQNQKIDYNGFFITLDSESLKVGHNSIVIAYSHSYDQGGTGLHKFIDPEDGLTYLYTYLWPYYANRLFPNFDQPNLKATYEMTVKAHKDWHVVSSAMQDNIKEDGQSKTWHFPHSKKFSSYVFSLHAGPYHVWEDRAGKVSIRLMSRQSLAEYVQAEEWLDYTKMGLDHFNDYFDIEYPFEKYDQLIVPDFNIGAMENVAAVTFAESYVQRGPSSRFQRQKRAGTILHEMAHMWFGDLVTKNWWNGLWLNESFATLMSAIVVSKLSEFSDLWHDFYLNTNLSAIKADKMVSTHSIEVPVPSTDDFFSVFDAITYQKGASVLNQLSHYVGKENFRLGVSNYLKKHAWSNTELNDFIGAQSLQAGMDLKSWSDKWLYTTGVNRIKVNYDCDDEKISNLTINQVATDNNAILRSQRIQLAFFDNTMQPYSVLPITIFGENTEFEEVKGIDCPSLVYPNYNGWGYIEVELDDVSKNNVIMALQQSKNPMLRSMLWTSLLEEIDVEYDHLIDAIKHENNDRIINQVLTALINNLDTMERQGNKTYNDFGEKLESLLWQQLTALKSNENTQIIRLESYINTVRTKIGQENLIGLLDSSTLLSDLSISQDHRWLIIGRLAMLNNDKAIDYFAQEKNLDQSDGGQISAIAVEASFPDLSIKKQWLSKFRDNENPLPFSNQRKAMENLFPANQVKLQELLLPEMIDALPMIKKTRDNYYQRSYARDLFAGVCTIKGLKLIEKILDKEQLGTTLYRFLSENVQKAQKCINTF